MIEVTYLTMTCDDCGMEREEDFEPSIRDGNVIFEGVIQRFQERGFQDAGDPDEWRFQCADCQQKSKEGETE